MKQYENMVVIFLDILGSKDMNTFEEKYKIHEIFHRSIKVSQELQGTKAKEHVIYTRKLFSFSDCAYIFYKYKTGTDEIKKNSNNLLQTALYNTSLITLELLNEGYLIRGGVSYGQAYYDDMSFFGPAVEDAYLIESTKAIMPRIMIDPKIGKGLFDFEKKIYDEVFAPGSIASIIQKRSYIPTIAISDSNDFILNKLYILEMEGTINLNGIVLSHAQMKNNINVILTEKLKKPSLDSRVIEKLEWMQKYINSSKLSLVDPNIAFTQLV